MGVDTSEEEVGVLFEAVGANCFGNIAHFSNNLKAIIYKDFAWTVLLEEKGQKPWRVGKVDTYINN